MKARLEAIARRNDTVPIAAIRGPGAMVAFDVVKTRGTDEPDPETTKKVLAKAREHGLILLSCGVFGNTIRLLVPLTDLRRIAGRGAGVLRKRRLTSKRTTNSSAHKSGSGPRS